MFQRVEMSAPFLGLNFIRCSSSIAGIKNASVFPEPVRAAPRTSLPASSGGIALACTGVIVLNPIVSRARLVGSDRSREENGSQLAFSCWSEGDFSVGIVSCEELAMIQKISTKSANAGYKLVNDSDDLRFVYS